MRSVVCQDYFRCCCHVIWYIYVVCADRGGVLAFFLMVLLGFDVACLCRLGSFCCSLLWNCLALFAWAEGFITFRIPQELNSPRSRLDRLFWASSTLAWSQRPSSRAVVFFSGRTVVGECRVSSMVGKVFLSMHQNVHLQGFHISSGVGPMIFFFLSFWVW